MSKINGNQITPGTVIDHDRGLWVAVKTNAVKPGKGGAFIQVETASSYKPAVLDNGSRTLASVYRHGRKDRRRYGRSPLSAADGLGGQVTAIP